VRHFRRYSDSGDLDEIRHIFGRHSGSGERHSWKLESIRRSPCPQKYHIESIKYKQLRILKIATCFIAYILKLMKEKHIIKFAIEGEFLIQKANRDDGIMVEGTLTHHISRC
jgi:hypothetical protein